MKHIKYIFIVAILSILAACSDEKDLIVVEPVEKIGNLYGLGTIFGWDSNAPASLKQSTEDPNLFIIEKVIKYSDENKQFKFTIDKGDWDKVRYLVPTSVDYNENVKTVTNGEYEMFMCSEGEKNLRDHFWGIPKGEDGTYRLTVNPKLMTLKVEKISNSTEETQEKTIYGLGSAFGWDSNNATGLTPDPENPEKIFTAQVTLDYSTENKLFKFILEKGDWDKIRYLVPTEVEKDKSYKIVGPGEYDMFLCSQGEGNLRDHFWGIAEGESGKYKLTVNIATLKLKVEKAVPEVHNIFGLGLAFGWDSSNPVALIPVTGKTGIFTSEVELAYSNENKQFKFAMEKGNWDKIRYLVPDAVDHNGNVKKVTTGEYNMFMCSEGKGNLRDHFWGIPENGDGVYRLTVDTVNLKLKVQKMEGGLGYDNLYGTGTAFNWASSPVNKDTEDPKIYVFEADLVYTAENKLFKFTLDLGDWDKIRYLVPESVDYNGNVKKVIPGEYNMFKCSQAEGNLRDHFWGIPEGQNGTYRFTVNTRTLKLKVEKLK
jgi:hypothetical protein